MSLPTPSSSNSTTGGFSIPQPGASLLLSFSFRPSPYSQPAPFFILGSGPLAAQRAFAAIEANASVVVLGKGNLKTVCEELRWRVNHGQVSWVDLDQFSDIAHDTELVNPDLVDTFALDKYFSGLPPSVSPKFLCITDTLLSTTTRRSRASARSIHTLCHSRNINVNTTDYPDLCDFSFATAYRFPDPPVISGGSSSAHLPTNGGALQIAITTNGQGCRLAGRIKREIVARLPRDVGKAVGNVGKMRALAKERDRNAEQISPSILGFSSPSATEDSEELDPCADTDTAPTPNSPVPQRPGRTDSIQENGLSPDVETTADRTRRRMKWVAQISEYWPLEKLAAMTEKDMKGYLEDEGAETETKAEVDPSITPMETHLSCMAITKSQLPPFSVPPPPPTSIHSIFPSPPNPIKPGQILLIGSGPGHPSLLTIAAHRALTELADIVLADKLVPAAVLALIPSRVEVVIAKKFPGNADRAQQEMMERALKEARKGRCVVRLKQGDPAIYGRFGEEILYFRNPPPRSPSTTTPAVDHPPLPPTLVIPGVSSALAAPTMFDIPCTQRGASTSFLITTPVGKGGKMLDMPKYERARTVVVLMGVARLRSVVKTLIGSGKDAGDYPPYLPIAIIERASMPDQRVVESTLEDIEHAMESAEVGAQRPPGMMVIGWSVSALWGDGNVDVLNEGDDGEGESLEKRASERTGILREASKAIEGEFREKNEQEMKQSEGTQIGNPEDVRRVRNWLGDGVRWRVREGLASTWDMFNINSE
ncbi:tetrapyrrole methylase [Lentinula edodes]|uniref:tetrapyrrole methylase n=1 Tax=Lentinula edodes TaxID=5353 RepID=UPI001E8E836A|nr:tetrapyrrole methylase [Lentinula edodes]KAH7870843.1 tetrapyrrole methylase [Lentinula edodes]